MKAPIGSAKPQLEATKASREAWRWPLCWTATRAIELLGMLGATHVVARTGLGIR